MKLGLIAGNGRFPFLVLEAARAAGHQVTIIALKEEAFPELEAEAAKAPATSIHRVSLGKLGTWVGLLEKAGATSINGTTNTDRTNYFETVPSNQLELALWLESDRMGYLITALDALTIGLFGAIGTTKALALGLPGQPVPPPRMFYIGRSLERGAVLGVEVPFHCGKGDRLVLREEPGLRRVERVVALVAEHELIGRRDVDWLVRQGDQIECFEVEEVARTV